MAEQFRRVVTGHDEQGKSVFIEDGPAPNVKSIDSMPGLFVTDLWVTGSAPADNRGNADAADRPIVLDPPPRGTVFRVVEFPPDSAWRESADAKEAFGSIGGAHASCADPDDVMMHKTATVDYVLILKGEIWAILEDGVEACLKQGEFMVQRGTVHSWSVRTPEPCLMAVVLIDADPV